MPVLFSFGVVTIRSFLVALVFAVLAMGFVLWRKGREEHYDEFPLFDAFIIANWWGLVAGRIVFIVLHFSQFGLNPISWLAFTSKPGLSYLAWAAGTILSLRWFAQKEKWDVFEVLDFWSLALCFGQIILWLGLFLDGSGFGLPAPFPFGFQFPGVLEPRLPIQLLAFLTSIALFFFLSWSEYHYRRFNWYRYQRHSAQAGFLFSVWLIISGVSQTIFSFLMPASIIIFGVKADSIIFTLVFVLGITLLLNRSGVLVLPKSRR